MSSSFPAAPSPARWPATATRASQWLRADPPGTTYTTSVCTGSLLLGAAGILQGLDATSHWAALPLLEAYGATPTLERVVERGKIITAAGVSSGIDMALLLAARIAGDALPRASSSPSSTTPSRRSTPVRRPRRRPTCWKRSPPCCRSGPRRYSTRSEGSSWARNWAQRSASSASPMAAAARPQPRSARRKPRFGSCSQRT